MRSEVSCIWILGTRFSCCYLFCVVYIVWIGRKTQVLGKKRPRVGRKVQVLGENRPRVGRKVQVLDKTAQALGEKYKY